MRGVAVATLLQRGLALRLMFESSDGLALKLREY